MAGTLIELPSINHNHCSVDLIQRTKKIPNHLWKGEGTAQPWPHKRGGALKGSSPGPGGRLSCWEGDVRRTQNLTNQASVMINPCCNYQCAGQNIEAQRLSGQTIKTFPKNLYFSVQLGAFISKLSLELRP